MVQQQTTRALWSATGREPPGAAQVSLRRCFGLAALMASVLSTSAVRGDEPPASAPVFSGEGEGEAPAFPRAGDEGERPAVTGTASARAGTFLPWTLSPTVNAQRAQGFVSGGYDGAWSRGSFEAGAEAVVWGPIALRAGGSYLPQQDRVQPWFGARAQLLEQGRHGLDGGLAVQYRAGGFNLVPAVEASLLLGRRFARAALFAQATYGVGLKDGEGFGDVRLAATRTLGDHALVGLEARTRVDLERQWPEPTGEAAFDVSCGPFVSYALGEYVLTAQSGVTSIRFRAPQDQPRTGVIGSLGIGRVF